MMIRTAITGGWLDADELADRRARLVDALVKLALDQASPIRDSTRSRAEGDGRSEASENAAA